MVDNMSVFQFFLSVVYAFFVNYSVAESAIRHFRHKQSLYSCCSRPRCRASNATPAHWQCRMSSWRQSKAAPQRGQVLVIGAMSLACGTFTRRLADEQPDNHHGDA